MVDWEVSPTQDVDVVKALMETLVDPRLPRPRASSNDPPSEDAQESVAKQLHAVVLLYNYYHRKQKPDVEFLSFRPFCQLAVKLRPSLNLFMKFTKESLPVELNDADNQLSVTEKAIKDACNIAVSLDVSRDVPVTEGCPISKVAVLLIDSKKENCYLEYGAVTEGVWSLIEKEINESSISLDILAEQKGRKKRKTDSGQASTFDKLEQIAYETVKDATSIASSDLEVLETHVVHSMSKEKSAAQFFMMHYSQSFDIRQSVSLYELVESLQGPLAEKNGLGWSTTKLIEFHHVLPYMGFISSWLSRKDSSSPLVNGDAAQSTKNYDRREFRGSKDLGQVNANWSSTKSSSADRVNENSENYQHKRKHSSAGKILSPENVVQSKERGNVKDDFKDIRDLLSDKKGSKITFAKSDNNDETPERGYLSDPSRGRSQSTFKDNNAIERGSVSGRTRSSVNAGKERKSLTPKTPYHTRRKNAPSPQHGTLSPEDRRKNAPSPQHDTLDPEDSVNLMVETAEPSKSNDSSCRDEEMTADDVDANISCDQIGIAAKQNPLAESEALNNIGVENATASADLLKSNDSLCRDERMTADNHYMNMSCNQSGIPAKENPLSKPEALHNSGVKNAIVTPTEKAAAALLFKRSQELSSRIRPMLDEQAVCENAAERMLCGGVLDLASRCMRHILSGNEHLLLNEVQVQDKGHRPVEDHRDTHFQTITRLLMPGKSSCQDLELICISNNLGLPRYTILPRDGKYMAESNLQINGLVLRAFSDFESSPREAREASAANMISRISEAYP